ncbi:MAG: hypothetical protein IJY46_07680 [Lentisphaeria bacterium]|nr:hypothetical protein [Lentisphaeria bacterium]
MGEEIQINVYKLIGDRCFLSEKTVRTAFARRPITYQTACKLRKALNLPTLDCFRIKVDNRGRKKPGSN